MFLPQKQKRKLCQVMDMLISLVVVIISPYKLYQTSYYTP